MKLSRYTNLRVTLLATAAVVSVGGPPQLATSASAQALQPVVDVCTGISLEPSAITDIVGDVAVPTATALEDLYDALLNVRIAGLPLISLSDVQIGAADTLDAYANGDPIALRVADTSGTLLAPDSECNLTADGYTLNNEAGLSIGGNQITGLGNGQAASAGELDAIAFGNNASTAVGANGAIAIGTDSSATAADSVALGSGSLADRGALTNYSAPGLTGTYSSVGSVSVGAAGSLRQITNLAPGTEATDAATVGQVQGAVDAIQSALGNGVQYDGAAQTSVTLAGTGGTTISNLTDGTLSDTSTDAVNGSQLFATNQNVTTNAGDIDALEASALQYDDATNALVTLDGVGGTRITNVAEGALSDTSTDAVNGSQLFATNQQVAVNADEIGDLDGRIRINADSILTLDDTVTTIDTRVTQNTTDIAALQTSVGNLPIGYVSNTDPTAASAVPTNSTALIGADPGPVTLGNVAAAELAAGSTEAVNGGQLFATNLSVGANTDAIDTLDGRVTINEGDLANLDTRVTVNEGDIANLDTRVTVNEGDISDLGDRVTDNEGDIVDIDARVAVNEGDIGDLNSSVTAIDTRVTNNTAQINLVQTQLANVPIGYVSDSDPTLASNVPTNTVALIGAGNAPVRLTNVGPGTLAAGSTDAVNGAQLFDTNQQVGANTAGIQANTDAIASLSSSGNALGVLYDDASRTSLTLDGAGGTTVSNLADGEVSASSDQAVNGSQLFATNQLVAANSEAIDNLDGRVTVNEEDIANLDSRVTVNEGDIADLDTRVTVNEGDIANLDTRVAVNEGDITSLDNRVTTNEGDIGTLNTTVTEIDARVTNNSTQLALVQNQVANVPLGYVSDADPTLASNVPTNTAALIGTSNSPVRLTNVQAGSLAAGSTDAVNGAQLAATNGEVARNRTDIDENTANIAAINNNLAGSTTVAVQYSDPDNPNVSNGGTVTNDVAFVGADATAPVALHNVAAGTRSTDAVNLGQVQDGLAAVMADSRAYTDLRFGDLQAGIAQIDFDLKETRRDAFSGTASAMAVSGIPQTITAGRSMVGGGVAHYRGETAFALGLSTTFDDGRGVVKAGATVDSRGNGGFSAGAGISF